MILYTNKTRFASIVTIRIDSVADEKDSLKIGAQGAFDKISVTTGFVDLFVEAGKELQIINNTKATFISSRAAS